MQLLPPRFVAGPTLLLALPFAVACTSASSPGDDDGTGAHDGIGGHDGAGGDDGTGGGETIEEEAPWDRIIDGFVPTSLTISDLDVVVAGRYGSAWLTAGAAVDFGGSSLTASPSGAVARWAPDGTLRWAVNLPMQLDGAPDYVRGGGGSAILLTSTHQTTVDSFYPGGSSIMRLDESGALVFHVVVQGSDTWVDAPIAFPDAGGGDCWVFGAATRQSGVAVTGGVDIAGTDLPPPTHLVSGSNPSFQEAPFVAKLDPAGAVVLARWFEHGLPIMAVGSQDGGALVLTRELSSYELVTVDAQGASTSVVALEPGLAITAMQLFEDGTLYASGTDESEQTIVASLASDGTERWRVAVTGMDPERGVALPDLGLAVIGTAPPTEQWGQELPVLARYGSEGIIGEPEALPELSWLHQLAYSPAAGIVVVGETSIQSGSGFISTRPRSP